MVVAVSAHSKLIWSVTSQQIRQHWNVFSPHLRAGSFDLAEWDFGLGPEPAFRCASCGRYHPVETGTIDHVIPRTLLHVAYIEPSPYGGRDHCYFSGYTFYMPRKGDLSVIPFDTDRRILRLHYQIRQMMWTGDFIDCYQFVYNKSEPVVLFSWPIKDFVENLLSNLQPLCAYCNSRKGNRW